MTIDINDFKRRKGTNYAEIAATYDSIDSLVNELVMRHRGDIPEVQAIALGEEIMKRVADSRNLHDRLVEALATMSSPLYRTAIGLKLTPGDLPNELLQTIEALLTEARGDS